MKVLTVVLKVVWRVVSLGSRFTLLTLLWGKEAGIEQFVLGNVSPVHRGQGSASPS